MKYITTFLLSAILSIAMAFNVYAGAAVNGNTITYSTSGVPGVRGTYYCVYLLTEGASIKCFKNMSTQSPTAKCGNTTNRKYLSIPVVANQNNTRTGLADSVRFTYSIDRSGIFNGTVTIVNPKANVTGVAFVVRDSASHYYSINDTQNITQYVYEALNPEPETEKETATEPETQKESETQSEAQKETETQPETQKETLSQKEVGKIKDSISGVSKSGSGKSTEKTLPQCVLKRLLGQISS